MRWKNIIKNKSAVVLVAEKDKQIIGFLVFAGGLAGTAS